MSLTTRGRMRTLVAGAAALAVLAAGCSGNDDAAEQEAALAELQAESDAADDTADAPAAPDTSVGDPVTGAVPAGQHIYLSRDPFDPIREPVVETVGTDTNDGDGQPGTPAGATDPDDGTAAPITDDGTAAPITNDGTACRSQGEAVCDGIVVSLMDITHQNGVAVAIVQVDGDVLSVSEGEVFADHFRVRSIEETCADLEYGDEPFRLCVGGSTLK